jgi:hypothetical protein
MTHVSSSSYDTQEDTSWRGLSYYCIRIQREQILSKENTFYLKVPGGDFPTTVSGEEGKVSRGDRKVSRQDFTAAVSACKENTFYPKVSRQDFTAAVSACKENTFYLKVSRQDFTAAVSGGGFTTTVSGGDRKGSGRLRYSEEDLVCFK